MSRRLRDGWPETYGRLSTMDHADLTPDQLDDLADSAWSVCRLDESLGARQLAYARYHEIHETGLRFVLRGAFSGTTSITGTPTWLPPSTPICRPMSSDEIRSPVLHWCASRKDGPPSHSLGCERRLLTDR
jgi:hypothetical protein